MKKIIIRKNGGTGNNMIEYMLALYLKSMDQELKIYGDDPTFLNEFGISLEIDKNETTDKPFKRIEIFGWLVNINKIVTEIQTSRNVVVIIKYNLFDKYHFMPMLNIFRNIFGNKTDVQGFDEKYLVIHIRLGDIATSKPHRNYPIVPFSFHRYILRKTNLIPVFIGQLDSGRITAELKKEFPNAIFMKNYDPLHDFECMRKSKNLSIAVSTLSFLAGFLSDNNTNIYVPMYGFLNKNDRPELDYIINDQRFHFYKFPKIVWEYSENQIQQIISKTDIEYEEVENPITPLKVCLLMWYDSGIKQYGDMNYDINKLYCEKYGYDIIRSDVCHYFDRKPHWERIPLMLKHLDNYDYCIWIDADAFFYIDAPPITDVIREFPNESFILSKDMDNKQPKQENCILNSGFFIAKNTPETKKILKEWGTSKELYDNRYGYIVRGTTVLFHDQGVLRLMYDKNLFGIRDISAVIDYGVLELYPRVGFKHDFSNDLFFKKTDGTLYLSEKYGLKNKPFVCHCALSNKDEILQITQSYYDSIFKK